MATTIVTKKGSGAPAASDLVEGELAVDTTNGRLYTENSSAAVVELGSNPSGNITFGDNGKAIFGAGSDLQIYHTGSDSRILDNGTGNLRIMANNLRMQSALGEQYIVADDGGAVTLYYDNAAKLATTSTGIDVTGVITTDGMTTSADINFGDDDKAVFGAGSDLQIYHDGTNSYIVNTTNDLIIGEDTRVRIKTPSLLVNNAADTENLLTATENGAVTLFYDNAAKLATSSSGIDVTGSITATVTGNEDVLTLISTDADENSGPRLSLTRNSASPADNDYVGLIAFNGQNSAAESIRMGMIRTQVLDVTDGTEDSTLTFYSRHGGTETQRLATTATGISVTGNIANASGDLTLDVAGDIILDAGGSDILLKVAGTSFASFRENSGNFRIKSEQSDKDMLFMGNDGGSEITALSLDMSDGGTASFNSHIRLGDNKTLSLGAGFDIEITSDGTNGTIGAPNGNLTVDVAGNIILDSDSGQVVLADGGSNKGLLKLNGNNLEIKSEISDADIKFNGNDGGSAITALSLDMSDAGTAIFNHDAKFPDNAYVQMGAGSDLSINSDGTNGRIFADNGDLTLDVAGDIILDADGGDIKFKDGGTEIGSISLSGSNVAVISAVQDEDIFFKGNDGGSTIDALALDMSEGGAATFNSSVTSAGLHSTTAGTSNFIAGVNAGNSIASGGNYNVVVGDEAGTALTTGDFNTALGYAALDAAVLVNNNVAVGSASLSTNVHSSKNVAVGSNSLETHNLGGAGDGYNTAVGYNAGLSVTTGVNNTFIGGLAGDATDDGANNTALGYLALSGNCGDNNTALGRAALSQTTGSTNTAIGESAGGACTSGSHNIFIGQDSGLTGSPGGAISTGGNEIVIGDENMTEAHIQIDWTVASDARDKTDFTALDLGLDFVKDLQPVTYKWDKRSKYGDKTADDYDLNAQTPDGTHKEDWLDIGFKAQEVEALEIAAGYNKDNKTNLVSSHSGDGKQMGLQYSKFVPILVKAIQEQQALIESLTARITTLEG